MFFILNMKECITIPPQFLGRELEAHIRGKLKIKVEGTTSIDGYVICLIKIIDFGLGKVIDTTGEVVYNVKYQALMLKLFVNEVVDCVVDKIESYGINVKVGPINIFLSTKDIPSDFKYNENNQAFISDKDNAEIKIDSEIRCRIKAISYEYNQFMCTATMNQAYLGPLK